MSKFLLIINLFFTSFYCFSNIEVLKTKILRTLDFDVAGMILEDNQLIIAGNNKILIMDPEKFNIIDEINIESFEKISALSYSEKTKKIIVGTESGKIYLISGNIVTALENIDFIDKPISSIAWSPDGKSVVFYAGNNLLIYTFSGSEEFPDLGSPMSAKRKLKILSKAETDEEELARKKGIMAIPISIFQIGDKLNLKWLYDNKILVFSNSIGLVITIDLPEFSKSNYKNLNYKFIGPTNTKIRTRDVTFYASNDTITMQTQTINRFENENVDSIKISPDGKKVALGFENGKIKIIGKKSNYKTNFFDERVFDVQTKTYNNIGKVKFIAWKNNKELIIIIDRFIVNLEIANPKFGEAYWIYPDDPNFTYEKDVKVRPAIIISTDEFNESNNVIVATSTTKNGTVKQNTVPKPFQVGPVNLNYKWSLISLNRLKSVSKEQLKSQMIIPDAIEKQFHTRFNITEEILNDIKTKLQKIWL